MQYEIKYVKKLDLFIILYYINVAQTAVYQMQQQQQNN